MTDVLGFGVEKRKETMGDIAKEKVHFRDGFRLMLESISAKHTFEECKTLVKRGKSAFPSSRNTQGGQLLWPIINQQHPFADVKLDPGFKDFFGW